MNASFIAKALVFLAFGFASATEASAQSFFEDGKCAIIVASRKSESEVRAFVNQNRSMGDFYVFLAKNGWHAISLGVITLNKAPGFLERNKARRSIPEDSYCSTGKGYIRQVAVSPSSQNISEQRQSGQSSGSNSDMAAWVEGACPKSIGPQLYASCTEREWAAINRPGWPNIDVLSADHRKWLMKSCPASIGPNLWRSCAERELAALQSQDWPNLEMLSAENKAWILQTCPRSIGPNLMKSCLQREYGAFVNTAPRPQIVQPLPTPQPKPKQQVAPKPKSTKNTIPTRTVKTASTLPRWRSVTLSPPSLQRAGSADAETVYRKVSPSVYKLFSAASEKALGDLENVSQGSAVAVSDRLAFTNCHVVEEGRFHVLFDDVSESIIEVRVVAADQDRDICVVQSEVNKLKAIGRIRSTANLSVGEPVYTIGNPSNLSKTIADGIVSGVRVTDSRTIQITAPISPGSSGGALVDGAGDLIGITTSYLKDSQNLNFAVAIEEFWK